MAFVTVIAVLCQIANPSLCLEERVTDTAMDDTLSLQDCLLGPPKLAKWLSEHPSYNSTGWQDGSARSVTENHRLPEEGLRPKTRNFL